MDGWIDGWMNEWMVGWMDGWMDGLSLLLGCNEVSNYISEMRNNLTLSTVQNTPYFGFKILYSTVRLPILEIPIERIFCEVLEI